MTTLQEATMSTSGSQVEDSKMDTHNPISTQESGIVIDKQPSLESPPTSPRTTDSRESFHSTVTDLSFAAVDAEFDGETVQSHDNSQEESILIVEQEVTEHASETVNKEEETHVEGASETSNIEHDNPKMLISEIGKISESADDKENVPPADSGEEAKKASDLSLSQFEADNQYSVYEEVDVEDTSTAVVESLLESVEGAPFEDQGSKVVSEEEKVDSASSEDVARAASELGSGKDEDSAISSSTDTKEEEAPESPVTEIEDMSGLVKSITTSMIESDTGEELEDSPRKTDITNAVVTTPAGETKDTVESVTPSDTLSSDISTDSKDAINTNIQESGLQSSEDLNASSSNSNSGPESIMDSSTLPSNPPSAVKHFLHQEDTNGTSVDSDTSDNGSYVFVDEVSDEGSQPDTKSDAKVSPDAAEDSSLPDSTPSSLDTAASSMEFEAVNAATSSAASSDEEAVLVEKDEETIVIESSKENAGESAAKETEWFDILGNNLLRKKILKEGDKSKLRPATGQVATINCQGFLQDGTIVDLMKNFKFTLNDEDVIQAIDLAVALMYPGEEAILNTDARYAYSIFGRPASKGVVAVPANSPLTYNLTLISVEDGLSSKGPLSDEMRVMLGDKKRSRGNEQYSRGNYSGAINAYKRGLKYLEGSVGKDVVEMKIKTLNNLSISQLKIKAYDMALSSLKVVLEHDPKNVKALYRQSQCYEGTGKDEEALEAIKAVVALERNNKLFDKDHKRLKDRVAAIKKKEEEMYRRMVQSPDKKKDAKGDEDKGDRNWSFIFGAVTVAIIGITAGYVMYKFR